MASFPIHLNCQVTDVNGDIARVSFPTFVADTTTLAALATDMAAFVAVLAPATNGKITQQSVEVLLSKAQFIVGTAPPTNAEYSSVTDGAHVAFGNSFSEKTSSTVPAPIEALFGAASNVVDPTNTVAAAYIGFFTGGATSPGGHAYNLYKGGIKVGHRARRRRSTLVP